MGLAQSPCGDPMSGLNIFPNELLCFTWSCTSVKRTLTRWRRSEGSSFWRSSKSMPRSMVSKARDISNKRRKTLKLSEHTACSINVLNVKTSSVVLLPGLYAACVIFISDLIMLKVLFITIIANIFLKIDSRIMGLRFFTGPLGLPGLGRGINCPRLSCIGLSPVSATLFRICAILSNTISQLFF